MSLQFLTLTWTQQDHTTICHALTLLCLRKSFFFYEKGPCFARDVIRVPDAGSLIAAQFFQFVHLKNQDTMISRREHLG
uniref:Uncharacterized protein n=1 Tax=Hordeum vulgare subsp. vulgare TaxID=112509 RepID=A0A8I6YD94_HORVV